MKGIIGAYGQKGLVTVGGWLDTVGTPLPTMLPTSNIR